MQIFSTVAALFLLLILPGCIAENILNAQAAESVKFADNDKDGYILIKLEPSTVPYRLHITRYDEQTGKLVGGSFDPASIYNDFSVINEAGKVYLAKRVNPGNYVFAALYHQLEWAACFAGGTREFSVNAGEAVFLGDLQPAINLQQIEQLAAEHHETTVIGLHTIFYNAQDGIVPLAISTPTSDSDDFLQAKRFETTNLPWLHDRLRPVTYKSADFKLNSDLANHPLCFGNMLSVMHGDHVPS